MATSIDALAIGLTFALMRLNMKVACATIGIVAYGITTAGFTPGSKAAKLFARHTELLARHTELLGGLIPNWHRHQDPSESYFVASNEYAELL